MFKSKITPIIAVTALVVAVFGATPLGQAASRLVLPTNSVGAAQLKKSAVSGKKIAKNAVTSAKVKDGTLIAADFKAGQLPAGPKGDKGDPGLRGPKGDAGKDGAPATKLWAVVDMAGNIVASSGVITPGPVSIGGKGEYELPFNRDISHCARVATIGGAGVNEGTQDGFIHTWLTSAPSVRVETGPDKGIGGYYPFSLAVFC